jgi:hypothetical protein
MTWSVPRIWEGGDVWILGGGPSVTEQFGIPEKVVNSVKAGTSPLSTFSPYMEAIHDKHVIGINVTYLIGNWIDMIFFGDNGFYLANRVGLAKFPGLKVSCNAQSGKDGFVKCMERDTNHPRGISVRPGHVSWNGNSGAAAISIATQAGAKRIMLLGFDMKLSDDSSQHFHDVYKRGKITNEKQLMRLPFERHLRGFPEIEKDAKAMGIEILNVSPNSAIANFPKFTLKELIYDNS